MNKKLLIILMLFLPVLQNFFSSQPIHIALMDIKFEVMTLLSIIALLLIVRIVTVIYFWVSVINWISSGFKLVKLLPCIISFIAIFCIDYSIKAILDAIVKRIKNKIQRIQTIINRKKYPATARILSCGIIEYNSTLMFTRWRGFAPERRKLTK